jgi:hypothetical protein
MHPAGKNTDSSSAAGEVNTPRTVCCRVWSVECAINVNSRRRPLLSQRRESMLLRLRIVSVGEVSPSDEEMHEGGGLWCSLC